MLIGECVDENAVVAFLAGRMPELENHLHACESCAELVTWVAADLAHRSRAPGQEGGSFNGPFASGSRVDRYQILGTVGRGGMGVVYAAYHPDLDRRVALKVVHDSSADSADRSARLLREARAIARLSHPNVVAVHDAGTVDDRVYIAMEFVEGQTVDVWLGAQRRSWREILDVFIAAGRGLAAAHAAGVVHRDFKPQNVMIGGDGTVRVMDFGLARLAEEPADAVATVPDAAPAAQPATVTRSGARLGTLAYMAPEQFRGEPLDVRADQFSFCVALHEALHGVRPALAHIDLRPDAEPAPKAAVPVWLRKVIARGLRPSPAERWPSMAELLTALGRDTQRRRRQMLAGAAVAALLLGGGAIAQRTLGQDGKALCHGAGAKLAGVWDPTPDRGGPSSPRREAVRAAFLATGAPFAAATWESVSGLLDRYAARWQTAYTETCRATHVRGDQSTEVMDLRMDCLNKNLGGLRALTDVFASADRTAVMGAVDATNGLGDLARCDDVGSLRAVVPPPRDVPTRTRLEALRGEVAALKALADTGKDSEVLARGARLIPELRELGYDPLLAEGLAVLGLSERAAGQLAASAATMEEAALRALASGNDQSAADVITVLGGSVAFDLGQPETAERWIRIGEALLTRLGPGHDRARAWVEQARGNLYSMLVRYDEAIRAYERAVVLKERALGRDHVDVAGSLDSLSVVLMEKGELARALATNGRALALASRAYGESSPGLGRYLSNRGEILNAAGRPVDALLAFRRAAQVWEPFGPENPYQSYALTGIGRALLAQGKSRDAVAPLERALVLRTAAKEIPIEMGETRFALAQALWDTAGDRQRAHRLAAEARSDFNNPPHASRRDEVDRWLESHPLAPAPRSAHRRSAFDQ
jgi:tetratricopeptide (TPR) repeat protein